MARLRYEIRSKYCGGVGCAQGECQGRLTVVARPGRDAGGKTAKRAPTIGADGQPRRHRRAALHPDGYAVVTREDMVGCFVHDCKIAVRLRPRMKRRNQVLVLDVVPNSFNPISDCIEPDFGRTQQAIGVIDDPHDAQWSGVIATGCPHAEHVQRLDGAHQKGRGAVIAVLAWSDDQRGFEAGARERDRGHQPCGPPPTTTISRDWFFMRRGPALHGIGSAALVRRI